MPSRAQAAEWCSRDARYEMSGYISRPSWHHLRETLGPVVTTRPAPSANPPAAYGAFRRVRRTTEPPTYCIAEAEGNAPWNELMQGNIEAMYGSDDYWGFKAA
eukprot:jgi/Tetstr1/462746/TSEL_000706.t1